MTNARSMQSKKSLAMSRASPVDKRDAEAAEIERLRDEGKQALSISWDDPPADSKPIEHEADPEGSNRD